MSDPISITHEERHLLNLYAQAILSSARAWARPMRADPNLVNNLAATAILMAFAKDGAELARTGAAAAGVPLEIHRMEEIAGDLGDFARHFVLAEMGPPDTIQPGPEEDDTPRCPGCGEPLEDHELVGENALGDIAEEEEQGSPRGFEFDRADYPKVAIDRHKLVAMARQLAVASGSKAPEAYAGFTLVQAIGVDAGERAVALCGESPAQRRIIGSVAHIAQNVASEIMRCTADSSYRTEGKDDAGAAGNEGAFH